MLEKIVLLVFLTFAPFVCALGAFNAKPNSDRTETVKQLQKIRHAAIEQHSLIPPLLRNVYSSNTAASRSVSQMKLASGGVVNSPEKYLHEDLPSWAIYGTTVVTDDYIRLTSNVESSRGSLINLEPLRLPAFELVVGFRVHSSKGVGADGLAIFVENRPTKVSGPLFGHPMSFRGLAILVDTYDNDGDGNNPRISLVYNRPDGRDDSRILNKAGDFMGDDVGGCQLSFRNTEQIAAIALRYRPRGTVELVVSTDNFYTETACVSVPAEEVPLPITENLESDRNKYYITLSAETGAVTDNHDINYVFVHADPNYQYEKNVRDYEHAGAVQDGQFASEKTSAEEELSGKSKHKYSKSKDERDRRASTSIRLEDLEKEKDPWEAEEKRRAAKKLGKVGLDPTQPPQYQLHQPQQPQQPQQPPYQPQPPQQQWQQNPQSVPPQQSGPAPQVNYNPNQGYQQAPQAPQQAQWQTPGAQPNPQQQYTHPAQVTYQNTHMQQQTVPPQNQWQQTVQQPQQTQFEQNQQHNWMPPSN